MCLGVFLHYRGHWVRPPPEVAPNRQPIKEEIFSDRCKVLLSLYAALRSLALVLAVYFYLGSRRIAAQIQDIGLDPVKCAVCYNRAAANPSAQYEFGRCSYLLDNSTRYPELGNLLMSGPVRSTFRSGYSDVHVLDSMNTGNVIIWSVIFGFGILVSLAEYLGCRVAACLGMEALNPRLTNRLRGRGVRLSMESICAHGICKQNVQLGSYHFRTVASFITLPVTMTVICEHFRWVPDSSGGCYQDIGFRHQNLIFTLFETAWLVFYLVAYIAAMLFICLVMCYCCRHQIYQLLRVCFLFFLTTALILTSISIPFLISHGAQAYERDRGFPMWSIVLPALLMFEVEWLLCAPMVCKTKKFAEKLRLQSRYHGIPLDYQEATNCRMVALLRGLSVRRRGDGQRGNGDMKRVFSDVEDPVGGAAQAQGTTLLGSRMGRVSSDTSDGRVDSIGLDAKAYGSSALEKLSLDPLFDKGVFRIVKEFAQTPRGAMRRCDLLDYTEYRLWVEAKDSDQVQDIQRLKRKLQKRRRRLLVARQRSLGRTSSVGSVRSRANTAGDSDLEGIELGPMLL